MLCLKEMLCYFENEKNYLKKSYSTHFVKKYFFSEKDL